MKIFVSALLFMVITIGAIGQDNPLPPPPPPSPPGIADTLGQNAQPVTLPEVMPQYNGGDNGLMTFISKNIMYPANEIDMGVEGVVYIEFVVERDGTTSQHKVLRGVPGGPGLEREALRVSKLIRYEKPAMQSGKPVRIYMRLPFRFDLN